MSGGSIVKFEDLGKPATVLIEKISAAIEGSFKPYQIKRLAKAKAEADKIEAKAEIEIKELQQRALSRFVAEEAKKQDNMENITEKALPLLNKDSEPQKMEDDWITNFFDKCRIISDAEMQILWAKILGGEANSPGTFSKRTINMLNSLDKTDTQLFTKLCGFVWIFGELTPLIYDEDASIYNEHDMNFDTINHLASINLITIEPTVGYSILELPKNVDIYYFDKRVILELKGEKNNKLKIGKVLLTKTGQELAQICEAKPVDGFYDYVINRWVKSGIIISSPLKNNS